MAARVRMVRGAKGGTVAVSAGVGRKAAPNEQAALIRKRMSRRK